MKGYVPDAYPKPHPKFAFGFICENISVLNFNHLAHKWVYLETECLFSTVIFSDLLFFWGNISVICSHQMILL